MTAEELQELTQHLIDAHGTVIDHARWRPRKAAKDLCEEFTDLLSRGDFWNQMETTAEALEHFQKAEEGILGNVRSLIADEARVLAKLGVDLVQSGEIISSVYDAMDLARVRTADTTPQGIRNLKQRLQDATKLICTSSRGPILHTMDFVISKRGALTLAAFGLGGANIWFAVAADGGALSHVSMKIAVAAAHGHLGEIIGLLG